MGQVMYSPECLPVRGSLVAAGIGDADYTDDSAHNGTHMGGRLGPGGGSVQQEEESSSRPDIAALRGRADSAREMPV